MSSEIERAARAHREAEAAKAASIEAARPRQEAKLDQLKRELAETMVDNALLEHGRGTWLRGIAVVIVTGYIAGDLWFSHLPKSDNWQLGGSYLALLAWLIVVVLSIWLLNRGVAAWRRRSMLHVGHGFDGAAYLRRLTEKRRDPGLVVTLVFANPPADKEAVLDAVLTWMPELPRPYWMAGDRLIIESPELQGVEYVSGKGFHYHYYTNAFVHRCFVRVLAKVVKPLDRESPVTLLAIDITGTRDADDAQP